MATKANNHNLGHPPGRRTVLNATLATAILNNLAGGAYVSTACAFVGISHTTFGLWRRRGEEEIERLAKEGYDASDMVAASGTENVDGTQRSLSFAEHVARRPEPFSETVWPFVVFLFQSDKARAAAEMRNLSIIQTAAPDSWQAAAWILERTHPNLYGRRERINLEGSKEGSPVQIQSVSVDDLEAQIKALHDGSE